MVAVVRPALASFGGTWLYAPSSPLERQLACEPETTLEQGSIRHQILDLPENAHRSHYRTVSSELFMPLFHHLFSLVYEPTFDVEFRRAWEGYRQINQIYGEAIVSHTESERIAAVLVEDVHLMLVAATVRARGGTVSAPLAYFHHVPWCEPEYFGILPRELRAQILSGLLAFDTVGFHCQRWADAFVACCERFLPSVTRTRDRIEWQGKAVTVVVAPAALDTGLTREECDSGQAEEWRKRLSLACSERAVVARVERADPSKNALRGLQAYELLLERDATLRDRVCMLVVLNSVRTWIPAYRAYAEACEASIQRINDRFPGRNGGPDAVLLIQAEEAGEFHHHLALAALGLADVLIVNSIFDGLNLVAKEAVIAGQPAIVLSQNAGVHAEFEEHAFSINPFDVEETAEALGAALWAPRSERAIRAAALRQLVEERTPDDWVRARVGSRT